jgi:hypothetical protein
VAPSDASDFRRRRLRARPARGPCVGRDREAPGEKQMGARGTEIRRRCRCRLGGTFTWADDTCCEGEVLEGDHSGQEVVGPAYVSSIPYH